MRVAINPLINQGEAVLLEAAQRLGNLPWALRETADNIRRRRNHRNDVLLELARPVALVCFGLIVGSFALAFFMPLVKLLNDLS